MNNWQHLVTRRLGVQVAIAWNNAFGKLFNKRYSTGIHNTLVYFNGNKTDYFVDNIELKQFNEDLDRNLDNHEFVAGMIPEAKEFVEENYKLISNLIKDPNNLSNKELISLYTEFSNHHANYYTRMWMVFRICERIILKLGSQLKEKIKDEHKVKELLRIFSIPLKPNDITNERMDLLKIAIMKPALKENELKNQIKIHTNRYQHIPMFDFDHDPFTEDHFLKELQLIKNPEEELIKIESSFEDRNTQFQKRLKELNPNNELENLITMLKKAVFLRDYRDKIRQQLNLKLKDLYKEIGSRIGLDNKSIGLLTNDEIESHLEKSMDFDRQELENRKNAFFLIQNRDKIEIYSGQSASEKAKEHNLYKKEENKRTLQGSTGSPGKIKGTAKIIYTNLDLKKINEGDIMVAAMTRQDFVPHMRKSKAVITNEGGVTCHAAIIARELGIPCIVGTENATELLNDGDLIEVDATKGIINKL